MAGRPSAGLRRFITAQRFWVQEHPVQKRLPEGKKVNFLLKFEKYLPILTKINGWLPAVNILRGLLSLTS